MTWGSILRRVLIVWFLAEAVFVGFGFYHPSQFIVAVWLVLLAVWIALAEYTIRQITKWLPPQENRQ